jgi:hypothetical protein
MRFINAPYVIDEQTTRAQWPTASMTWGEHRLFSQGWLTHRDVTCSPESCRDPLPPHPKRPDPARAFGRSRQDAPAGAGSLLIYSPLALERSHRGFRMPDSTEPYATVPRIEATSLAPAGAYLPPVQHWDPVHPRTARSAPRFLPPVDDQPWQADVHTTFPRCTAHHVRVDKGALAEKRAATRWAARLSAREA